MKAVILAGGRGTRMDALFPGTPKPMIPVCGKPLLEWQIRSLVRQKITDVTLIVGYLAEAVRRHFGDGARFGARVSYIVEASPLGTGGALSLLPREDTLILFGDIYCDIDFSKFVAFHYEKQADVTIFAHPNSHPRDSDIVVTGDDARVNALKSKNDKSRATLRNLVNAGLYVFAAAALPKGEAAARDLERDLIVPKLPLGNVYAYRSTEYVKDMGTPERLRAVETDVKNGLAAARNLQNAQRAVFVDRDGTINIEDGFITKPEQLSLIPGAARAIRRLNMSPYLVICVTNQPVIARGEVSFEGLDMIHARLDTLLASEGAYLDDLFFCPHHPDKGYDGERPEYKTACDCRKPKPGMLLEAAKRYNIDLSRSYIIGDRTSDVAAGQAAGCVSVGVKTGTALSDGKYAIAPGTPVYSDVSEAADYIAPRNNEGQ